MGKEQSKIKESVVLVFKNAATGKVVKVVDAGSNIVTNAGDRYYAQKGAGEAVTHTFSIGQIVVAKSYRVAAAKTCTFGRLVLQTFGGAGVHTYYGRKTFESGYPKTNDSDTDNPHRTADGVTYKRIYTTSQANGTIKAVAICRNGGRTSASGQLLNFKTLSSPEVKTSSLTLTVYITHVFNGV